MRNIQCHFFILLTWMLLLSCPLSTSAKVYLTRQQAEKVCFPEAERFEWQSQRYTRDQIKKIYESSRLKVIDPGILYGVAYRGDKVIGVLVFDRCIGKHEYIDYVIALNPAGQVKQVEILNYRESWGYEVRREGWRKQFIGKHSAADIKLNDGIHNISGATLSCRGITRGVKRVCHSWDVVVRPALVAAGRLPK